MGPHGVLVGATGSGKSELLRSLVAGLAARHAPEELAFVLVDYKGGAAFADLSRLPHVAGLITNLQRDLSLVDRMHAALIGEQERRQTMLREAGNLDDIVAYQARAAGDGELPPMPDLLVIVDEFAELLAARPEFIDLFVGLGRVGRSLGIHLLLSSQRLDEGRLRGLESHLRYRLCLRTYSATESKLVLGTPDAYLLPSLPGLGYLKVDTEKYVQFRAGLASGAHAEDAPAVEAPAVVRAFGPEARPVAAETDDGSRGGGPSELQVLVDRLTGDRPPVHQVWVDPLPAAESLDRVLAEPPWWRRQERAEGLLATIGRLDRPSEQRTEPFVVDLAGSGGHLAVVGSPRTGKSTVLRTLASALIWRHTPDQVQIYGIDLGGGLLAALEGAPHVGGIAGKLDREAVTRVVRQLRTEVEDRESAFREAGHESMTAARAAGAFADVFLLVDGWEAFKREFEGLDRELEELAATGLSFGVHVVVAANRWAEIRPALLDNLGSRLELRLHDAIDSLVSRKASQSLPADVPGRGLTMDGLHFQIALPRSDGEARDEGTARALGELVDAAAEHWRGEPAPPIRLLPRELDPSRLPPPSAREGVPIGVEERGLDPVWVDFGGPDPHFLVFGDSQTGKSSLLRGIGRGLIAAHEPDQLQLVVVDVRRSLLDLAHDEHVMAYAASPPAAQQAAERLRAIAGERMAPADASPLAAPTWHGPRYVVLFDDYDLVAGPTGGPLAPLLDVLAVGGDVGLSVVLSRRVGGSARGAYEAVFGRLRELGSPGVLLSGDPGEGPLLGGTKARPQPPGRGLFVRRGERPVLVQTAFAPAADLTHRAGGR